jgi:hypothetical protein
MQSKQKLANCGARQGFTVRRNKHGSETLTDKNNLFIFVTAIKINLTVIIEA